MVEQSYKDLTQPAEDKNPLTGMSSHLCTRVLNTSHSRRPAGSRIDVYHEKDQYEEGERKEIHMGSVGGREGGREPISIPILVWVSRSAVTQSLHSVPSVGSKLIRKLCARPIPGFPMLCSPIQAFLLSGSPLF